MGGGNPSEIWGICSPGGGLKYRMETDGNGSKTTEISRVNKNFLAPPSVQTERRSRAMGPKCSSRPRGLSVRRYYRSKILPKSPYHCGQWDTYGRVTKTRATESYRKLLSQLEGTEAQHSCTFVILTFLVIVRFSKIPQGFVSAQLVVIKLHM